MSAFQIFTQPSQQALDTAANVLSGATLTFSLTGSSTATNAYSDSTLTTPVANPLSANAAGVWAPIFLNPTITYRIVLKTQAGAVLQTWDPANEQIFSGGLIGLFLYPRTTAESAALVTPTNYAIPNHEASGGIFYPERYGTNATPGTTQMSATIQTAISVATAAGGGEVRLRDYTYFLGVTAITVPSSVRLTMSQGGKFTANTAVVANMPEAYVIVNGSNITLDGLFLDFGSSPYGVTYAAKGIFIALADNSDTVEITRCRSAWPVHSVYSFYTGGTTTGNSLKNINIHHNQFVSADADVYLCGKSPNRLRVDDNIFATDRPAYIRVGGAIMISPAVDPANGATFTESNYDNDYGFNISACRNIIGKVVGRPIRLINCKQFTFNDNQGAFAEGGSFSPNNSGNLFTSDNWTMDLCRDGVFNGNSSSGGGENGVDFLSCQNVTATCNTIVRVNTSACAVGFSDVYLGGGANFTDKHKLLPRNITISDNRFEGFFGLQFYLGQNIRFNRNQMKFYRQSTTWSGSFGEPVMLILDNATAPSTTFYGSDRSLFMDELDFQGNQLCIYAEKVCTFDAATDTVTTDTPHEYTTGDKIQLWASGSSTTVDFPAGVNYQDLFYVIVTGLSTFKLATTWANAWAGTAINITSNGLVTAGAAIQCRECTRTWSVTWSNTFYAVDSKIVLDENFPGFISTDLFSTFSSISTGVALLLRNRKHEHLFNPAVTYGGGPDTKGAGAKFIEVNPRMTSDGVNTYGLEVTDVVSGGYVFGGKGAKISKYTGTPADGYIRTYLW